MSIDATHDPARRSWVTSANDHPEFPIQNLPLGVVRPASAAPRVGIAIGEKVLDGPSCVAACGLSGAMADALLADRLNVFFALSPAERRAVRTRVSELLSEGAAPDEALLHDAAACTLDLPAAIGDYTDFYAGIHHATTVGRLMRPDTPLLPNYKYLPVAYHGRASSVRISGIDPRRPNGLRKPANDPAPSFGPSRNLDYELELGVLIAGRNELGEPVRIDAAADRIAGICLLNDWSARDIQGFEYQPLGPFLAKNFQTTISPWVVTTEALAPFRTAQLARPEGDPAPLPHLLSADDQAHGALDITLDVLLTTQAMRDGQAPPYRLSSTSARHLYWTVAQMVAHHTSGGCDLKPGDLFGTGTISGPADGEQGSLLEMSQGGRAPITLPSGETRRFLEDGDEIIFRGRCKRPGFVPIGFGECRGTVRPALPI